MVMDHELQRVPEHRRKTYATVAHDTILWHLVNDQRPGYVEAPTDARDWILTVDFRLISFDSYKENYNKLTMHQRDVKHWRLTSQ